MDFIVTPLVVFIVFSYLYKVIKLYATRRERILFIEKSTTPPPYGAAVDMPDFGSTFRHSIPSRFQTLRWALLLIGVGVGILIGFFIAVALNAQVALNPWMAPNQYGVVLGSAMLLFGGIGLMVPYVIESRDAASQTDN